MDEINGIHKFEQTERKSIFQLALIVVKKDSRLSIIITIIVIFKYNYNSEEPNKRGIINMQRIIIVDVNSKKFINKGSTNNKEEINTNIR